ncbi:MAG TPA: outer membrane beta-barrel protein [Pyrinomonadaceae bacterium]
MNSPNRDDELNAGSMPGHDAALARVVIQVLTDIGVSEYQQFISNILMRQMPLKSKRSPVSFRASAIGSALLVTGASAFAQAAAGDVVRVERLEKENAELRKRLDALESVVKKEGLAPSSTASPKFVSTLSETTLSGFVTASYFHDTSDPPGGTSPGYLWNRRNDSFSLNKVKITLASPPAARSGEEFSAAYRASLIFGQDAPIVNSGASTIGFQNLREAYVELNVPIGTGVNVKAGELISLLNYESGDGGAANDNFSQGYQWFFTGNGPAAGVQLGYTLTDAIDVKVRVQNGLYAGPVDNNSSKTVVAALGIKPTDKIWLSLIGFAGREDSFITHVQGGSLLGGYQIDEKWHVGTELDYFNFRTGGKDSQVYSLGGWLSYALCDKVMPAVRAEFISDKDGVDINGALGVPANSGQDIFSVALTLNIKPVPNVKIQPEIRYDHTSLPAGFGKRDDRFLPGIGVSYLF